MFRKKYHNAKKLKGGPFSPARYCMLRGKTEKSFWFSSLGQIFQNDTIKFRRPFVALFWLVRVDLKKVAFHFMMHEKTMHENNFINYSREFIGRTNQNVSSNMMILNRIIQNIDTSSLIFLGSKKVI